MARHKPPTIPDARLDQLLVRADSKASACDPTGLLDSVKKALAARAVNAKWTSMFLARKKPAMVVTVTTKKRGHRVRQPQIKCTARLLLLQPTNNAPVHAVVISFPPCFCNFYLLCEGISPPGLPHKHLLGVKFVQYKL